MAIVPPYKQKVVIKHNSFFYPEIDPGTISKKKKTKFKKNKKPTIREWFNNFVNNNLSK